MLDSATDISWSADAEPRFSRLSCPFDEVSFAMFVSLSTVVTLTSIGSFSRSGKKVEPTSRKKQGNNLKQECARCQEKAVPKVPKTAAYFLCLRLALAWLNSRPCFCITGKRRTKKFAENEVGDVRCLCTRQKKLDAGNGEMPR